jgi:hypothetical protein
MQSICERWSERGLSRSFFRHDQSYGRKVTFCLDFSSFLPQSFDLRLSGIVALSIQSSVKMASRHPCFAGHRQWVGPSIHASVLTH